MKAKRIMTPEDIVCARKHVRNHTDGSMTVYANYVDGMEVWHFNPAKFAGGRLMRRFIGEQEVY